MTLRLLYCWHRRSSEIHEVIHRISFELVQHGHRFERTKPSPGSSVDIGRNWRTPSILGRKPLKWPKIFAPVVIVVSDSLSSFSHRSTKNKTCIGLLFPFVRLNERFPLHMFPSLRYLLSLQSLSVLSLPSVPSVPSLPSILSRSARHHSCCLTNDSTRSNSHWPNVYPMLLVWWWEKF